MQATIEDRVTYALRNVNDTKVFETKTDCQMAMKQLAQMCLLGSFEEDSDIDGVAPVVRGLINKFGVTSPDDALRATMTGMVLDEKVPMMVREGCLAFLMHQETILNDGRSAFEALTERQRIDLSGPWVRPMVRLATEGSGSDTVFPKLALQALVHNTTDRNKIYLIDYIEGVERMFGVDLDLPLRGMVPH